MGCDVLIEAYLISTLGSWNASLPAAEMETLLRMEQDLLRRFSVDKFRIGDLESLYLLHTCA
jgi:hypothetical protein